jgi:MFS family permease
MGYGIGFAMVISSTSPLMCEITSPILVGTSMGFLSAMMDIGQTLGPMMSGIILATTVAYAGLFTFLTMLLIVAAIVFTFSNADIFSHKTS